MKKIILIGNDLDLVDQILFEKKYNLIGIIDKRKILNYEGVEYLGSDKNFFKKKSSFLCTLDNGVLKEDIIKKYYSKENFLNFVSKECYFSKSATLGVGNILQKNTKIMGNVVIGDHCKINIDSTIHHETKLENFVTLGPGVRLLGNVKIRNKVFIGSEALILPGVEVMENSIIGAGSVVTKNIKKNSKVKGNPAR